MVTVFDMCSTDEDECSWICVSNVQPLEAKMTEPVPDSAKTYVVPGLQEHTQADCVVRPEHAQIVAGCLRQYFND